MCALYKIRWKVQHTGRAYIARGSTRFEWQCQFRYQRKLEYNLEHVSGYLNAQYEQSNAMSTYDAQFLEQSWEFVRFYWGHEPYLLASGSSLLDSVISSSAVTHLVSLPLSGSRRQPKFVHFSILSSKREFRPQTFQIQHH